MSELDHVVLAAPDLEAAKARFEEATGVAPGDGGPHVGLGTRNAMVSFGEGRYLEIIAPDPEQDSNLPFAEVLRALPAETLWHWAVRVEGLAAESGRLRASGLSPSRILSTSRARPDGTLLEWELMGVAGHAENGFVPFYIDWLDCAHPTTAAPVVGRLTRFVVTAPADSTVHKALTPLPDGIALEVGPLHLALTFDSPRGPISYEGDQLQGFPM
jgi:catechol 2,3-dioxygenase-like lactoylglutathione lyase family enzyme